MLETKEQKQYFVTTLVLIVILVVVSFFNRTSFRYKEVPLVKKPFDYNAYLASLKVDVDAGRQALQQVISEEDIRKEVEKELDVNQQIVSPKIDENKILLSSQSGSEAVTEYLRGVGQASLDFANSTFDPSKNLFSATADSQVIEQAISNNQYALERLSKLSVPQEALNLHKAALSVYQTYLDTLRYSKAYAQNPEVDPWSKLYHDFVVINDNMTDVQTDLKTLANKYKITDLPVFPNVSSAGEGLFIKRADAIFGLGDTTFIVGNIPEIIEKAIKEGLAAAFANFASSFLNKLVNSIEKNYVIANFMYYSDALVRGQYVNDYLDKYVKDSLDKNLITNFIPQFNCGSNANLRPIFKAKADQYLGFDPETIDPNDPDYYIKMSKVGSFLSTPNGWQLHYQDLAEQAKSEAEKAVDRELSSSGLKTPRDLVGTKIAQSISSINSAMSAIMNAQLNLGVVNVDKIVSSIVKNLTYNLFNSFVFKGATVYKEQSVCLAASQLTPLVPTTDTTYIPAPPPPTPDQVIQEQCRLFPSSCVNKP